MITHQRKTGFEDGFRSDSRSHRSRVELARRIAGQVEPTPKAAKRGAKNPEWNLYIRVLRAVSAKMCPTRDVAEAIALALRLEPNALWRKAWGDNWKLPPWERHYGPPRPPRPEPGAKWEAYLKRCEDQRLARLNAPLRGDFREQLEEWMRRRGITSARLVRSVKAYYPSETDEVVSTLNGNPTSQQTAAVIADVLDAWVLYEAWKKLYETSYMESQTAQSKN